MIQAFCKNETCSPVDPGHTVPLLHDDNHLTLFGSLALTPYIKNYWIEAQRFL